MWHSTHGISVKCCSQVVGGGVFERGRDEREVGWRVGNPRRGVGSYNLPTIGKRARILRLLSPNRPATGPEAVPGQAQICSPLQESTPECYRDCICSRPSTLRPCLCMATACPQEQGATSRDGPGRGSRSVGVDSCLVSPQSLDSKRQRQKADTQRGKGGGFGNWFK